MSKITLQQVANLENENSAVAQLNSNTTIIQNAFDNTLSLDGTLPNTMSGNLDMSGGGRIINLSQATTQTEPVRKAEFDSAVFGNTVVPTVAGTANQITSTPSGITYTLSFPNAMTLTGHTLTGGTYASVTMTAPILGTPTSGTLTNCTGLPVAGLVGATGVVTFLGTPSSSNLAAAVTDETGSGALVFANTPTLVTPVIGAATGTSVALTSGGSFYNATGVPAGGTTGAGLKVSSTANLGVFFGSGLPTLSAAQGSLYIRTDGSSSSTRLYVNSTGSTTWVNITSAS